MLKINKLWDTAGALGFWQAMYEIVDDPDAPAADYHLVDATLFVSGKGQFLPPALPRVPLALANDNSIHVYAELTRSGAPGPIDGCIVLSQRLLKDASHLNMSDAMVVPDNPGTVKRVGTIYVPDLSLDTADAISFAYAKASTFGVTDDPGQPPPADAKLQLLLAWRVRYPHMPVEGTSWYPHINPVNMR